MNYTERAKQLGFSAAAVMDLKIWFSNRITAFSARGIDAEIMIGILLVHRESGSVEEMKEKALSYNKTLVLQTTQSNDMDYKKQNLSTTG